MRKLLYSFKYYASHILYLKIVKFKKRSIIVTEYYVYSYEYHFIALPKTPL